MKYNGVECGVLVLEEGSFGNLEDYIKEQCSDKDIIDIKFQISGNGFRHAMVIYKIERS